MTGARELPDAEIRELLEQADPGPWWFDGRDVFHKPPGTNLDQIIVPLGHVLVDTYTADGAVNPATVRLMAMARALAEEVLERRAAMAEADRMLAELKEQLEQALRGVRSAK